ncbi:VOC family protein [Nitratireductor luteus]|uniref:VOC family protein n=1 Tax=Nitratireductor luteus TaxID=2976980 RepID=UPI00223EA760|nr:VOC family protein [Nitratireductor luteus]
MKFSHVSMVARDADGLAEFYKRIFGCEDRRPRKTMSGEKASRGNGLPNAEIYSAWLTLPGVDGPFLEILEYNNTHDRPTPLVNEPGYGHISFEVENIQTTFAAVVRAGGKPLGEITDFGTADTPSLVVYMRDPEGNVVELEQRSGEI